MKIRNLILPLVLVVLFGVCANANSASLESCPIANSPFYMISEGRGTAATVKKFFDACSKLVSPNSSKITWEKPADNYYLINITVKDIGTGKVTTEKFGLTVTANGNAVFTDYWAVNGKRFPAMQTAQMFIKPYMDAGGR